jgi:hypothetical protein
MTALGGRLARERDGGHVHGQGSVTHLAAVLSQIDGVESVVDGDVNDASE